MEKKPGLMIFQETKMETRKRPMMGSNFLFMLFFEDEVKTKWKEDNGHQIAQKANRRVCQLGKNLMFPFWNLESNQT